MFFFNIKMTEKRQHFTPGTTFLNAYVYNVYRLQSALLEISRVLNFCERIICACCVKKNKSLYDSYYKDYLLLNDQLSNNIALFSAEDYLAIENVVDTGRSIFALKLCDSCQKKRNKHHEVLERGNNNFIFL